MTSVIIGQPTVVETPRGWRSDPKVSACFRALFHQLHQRSASNQPLRVVGITGCRRGEGVSTVAGRLAIAAAEDGAQKVLLVDASQATTAIDRTGAADLSDQPQRLDSLLRPTSIGNVWKLPLAAACPQWPAVDPQYLHKVLGGLSFEFSFIVVDLPPAAELGRLNVAAAVDGILLVVEAESTRRSVARAAATALAGSRWLGAVLNKQQESNPTDHASPTH